MNNRGNNQQQGSRPGGGPRGRVMFVEKPKNMKGTVKRLAKYIGSNKKLFFMLILMVLIVTVLGLVGPHLQGEAIDAITLDKEKGKLDIDYAKMISMLIWILVVFVLSSVFSYFQGILSAHLSQNTVKVMRKDLFDHIVKLPIKYTDTHAHGDIMSRMTNDVDNISNTISQSIGSLFSGVLTILGSLIIMLYYNWFLTIISLSSVFFTIIATKYLSKFMRRYFKKQQSLLGKLNGHVEETVTGYKTVVAYSKEEKVEQEFNDISNELKRVGIKANIFGGVMGPVMNIISNSGFLLICGFGGWLAATKSNLGVWPIIGTIVTVGTIQKFIQYSKKFSRPINEIANLWAQLQTSMAAAERVFEIMDSPLEIDEGQEHIDEEKFIGKLSFKNVNFSYVPGEQVLFDFNLDVEPGQKIALVGATGSGKTTVVNLLMRFYDIDSGSITIDGVDIRDIKKKDLRETVSIVLQDTVLFSNTIKENIRYGELEASMERIEEASRTANSNYFIERLPEQYETVLTESGSNLSQGQRQLLSIARAILADPKILILDEATSSVDTRTEKNIQDAMVALMKNRTSLIIAHRLSTIQDADMIIVMDKGRVVERGNHKELLAMKGKYYNLYQTQFAGNQI